MKKKSKFVWEQGDIQIIKKGSKKSFEEQLVEHLIVTGEKFNSCHAADSGRFCSGSSGGGGGAGGTTVAGGGGTSEEFKPASNDELNNYYDLSNNCG